MGKVGVVLGIALAAAGCAAGGDGGRASSGKSVLDLTWGWGWNRTGSRGAYSGSSSSPAQQERRLDYYRDHVRTEDAQGRALKPVDQVQFVAQAKANAPTGEAPPPAGFVDTAGRPVRLEDWRGKKNLVLVFTRGFPGYICPLCTSYTAQIASRYADIAAAGAEVLVIFPGDPSKVGEFVQAARDILEEEGAGALPFPVLLDVDLKQVHAFGIDGDLAKPSTYVIDRAGKVRFAFVGDQPHERPDVETILAEVRRAEGTR